MKKTICKIMVVLLLLNFCIVPNCFAMGVDVDNIFQGGNPDANTKIGIDNGIVETENFSMSIISNLIVILRVVGIGIAIIILMTLGAKFIWGSVEQKAEVKKHLIVYITGVAVLIMASFLLGILQDFIVGNFNF